MENENREKINKMVVTAKYDMIFSFLVFVVVTLVISIMVFNGLTPIYLFFILIPLFFLYGKIISYINIKAIKRYIEKNDLYNKMGKIEYWNEEYYLLTDNYIIIRQGKIFHFKYDEIKEIEKRTTYNLHRISTINKHIYIKLFDEKVYRILVNTTSSVNEEYRDITDFLLAKNKNIKVIDTKKTNIKLIHK